MTPEDEIRRAGKAKEVLENEMFKESFQAIEEGLLTGIRTTAFKDAELREKLCMQYTLLHTLRDQLRTHMETGLMAEEIIRQKTITDRIKEFVNY